MTSATGSCGLSAESSTRLTGASATNATRRGFTLVELMIVITIIILLMGLVAGAAMRLRARASKEATESLIDRLKIAIQDFRSVAGRFPFDGIDREVVTRTGSVPVRSGAALTYALSQPLERKIRQADDSELSVPHDAIITFKQHELFIPDAEDPEVAELLDAWGQPLHYDCLTGGVSDYSPQDDETYHLENPRHREFSHKADPREAEGQAVHTAGGQNLGSYDLWSHGPNGHTSEELPEEFIGNWQFDKETGT